MNRNRFVAILTGSMMLAVPAFADECYPDICGHFDGEFTHVGGMCATVRLIEYPRDVYAIDLSRHALMDTINMKAMMNYRVRIRLAKDVALPRRNTLPITVWCAKDGGLELKEFQTIEDVWGTKP